MSVAGYLSVGSSHFLLVVVLAVRVLNSRSRRSARLLGSPLDENPRTNLSAHSWHQLFVLEMRSGFPSHTGTERQGCGQCCGAGAALFG